MQALTIVEDSLIRGSKQYELSNHLGNVLVTISDRRLQIIPALNGTSGIIADLMSASDYYGGGSPMPGRNFNSNSYRYGYNKGSEKDDEITGVTGSHFTTEFREGDTRLLIWWGGDPKPNASLSPYSYMNGNPILFNDPLGDIVDYGKLGHGGLKNRINSGVSRLFSSSYRTKFNDW